MVTQRQMSDVELLLLTTPDDTEDQPWMVVPEFQWRVVELLMSIMRQYVARTGQHWHLAAELKIVIPRAIAPRTGISATLDVAPDFMIAEGDDAERTSWNVMEEGQPPFFVLEVVTDASWSRDTETKPHIYDVMGVREYAVFAPRRNDGGPLLFGYHRDHSERFVPWTPDDQGVLHSSALDGLGLYVEDGKWLRVRDSTGNRLPSFEEEAARAEAEAARAEAEAARAEAEAEARQAAERRLAEVEAELARLRSGLGDAE